MLIAFQSDGSNDDYRVELLDWYNKVWKEIDERYTNEFVRVYEKNGDVCIHLPNKDVMYTISRTDGTRYTNEDIMYLLEL